MHIPVENILIVGLDSTIPLVFSDRCLFLCGFHMILIAGVIPAALQQLTQLKELSLEKTSILKGQAPHCRWSQNGLWYSAQTRVGNPGVLVFGINFVRLMYSAPSTCKWRMTILTSRLRNARIYRNTIPKAEPAPR